MFRRSIWAVMALALAAPASAMQGQAQLVPIDPDVIQNPDWQRMPSAADYLRLYPPVAMAEHVAGRSKMSCRVQADGELGACTIIQECPTGLGFGQAMLDSAKYFKMRPVTVDGQRVEGRRVILPFVWRVEGAGLPAACGTEPPPAPIVSPPPPLGFRAPPAAAAPEPRVDNPDWVRMPTGDDLARLYPRQAMSQRQGGHTVMKCRVRKDGTLTDCTIVQENPPGQGFGEAALASAKYFKMTPTTKAGTSVEGGVVLIPMRWLAP